MNVKLKRVDKKAAELPKYQTEGAAGFDLQSAMHGFYIAPGEIKVTDTGFLVELDPGYEGQVRSRSGMSAKGIIVANAPGTIDSDYRGEIRVILANIGNNTHYIGQGDRIAQMVIAPVVQANITEVTQLSETDRGSGGFGSTGN